MSPTGVGLFVSPLDLHSAQWNLSFRAPDTLADKLNEQFKDPTAAQVSLLSPCKVWMTVVTITSTEFMAGAVCR